MLDKQPLDSLRFWWTPVNKPRGTACRYCRHSSLHLSSFSSLSCSLPLLSVSHSLSFFIFTFSLDHSSRPIKALKCVVHRCWSLLFSQCDCCCANPRAQDELHHVKLPEATVKHNAYLLLKKGSRFEFNELCINTGMCNSKHLRTGDSVDTIIFSRIVWSIPEATHLNDLGIYAGKSAITTISESMILLIFR